MLPDSLSRSAIDKTKTLYVENKADQKKVLELLAVLEEQVCHYIMYQASSKMMLDLNQIRELFLQAQRAVRNVR